MPDSPAAPPSPSRPLVVSEVRRREGYDTAHHTPRGFRNVHGGALRTLPASMPGFLLKLAAASRTRQHAPLVRPDEARLATPPRRLRLTWLGHSAVFAQFSGLNVLLDPMLGPRASPSGVVGPRRLHPPALAPAGFPGVDVVVLSHDHYDHLDAWTVRVLVKHYDPLFVVPLGVDRLVTALGARRVVALDWYEEVDVTPEGAGAKQTVTFAAAPALHFSGRGLHNRNGTLWASWWLTSPGAVCYFGGDSGLGTHYDEMAARFPAPDVALMPIGAYEPRAIMAPVHMDPPEALDAAKTLGAKLTLPTHWGTFVLTTEPVDEPPRTFTAAARLSGMADRVQLWKVGETVEIEPVWKKA